MPSKLSYLAKSLHLDKALCHKLQCTLCPLNNNKANKYQHIEPHGSLNPDVLMLGLGPGSEETEHNQFFYGNSGQYLKSCITEEQHRTVRFNNVTRTRHLENTPPYEAVECCRPSVEGDIAATRPKLIIGLGGYPLSWVLGIPNPSIQAWRSHPFPVNIAGHTCWFYPTFHPAYILRNFYLDDVFKRDIANAYKFLARGLIPKIINHNELFKNCHALYQLDVIEQALTSLYQEPVIAIDIETTPGRPYKDRAKIFSISVGTDKHTIAFPWQHLGHHWSTLEFEKLRRIFRAFIRNKKQRKIAHNAAFEIEWLVHEYDDMYIAGSNWVDTMSPGYCLGLGGGTKEKGSETGSEKVFRGLLSLDNMCRVFLGFWLKELSPVDRTNIERTAIHDVLKYNSMDTASTYVLKSVVGKEIEYQGLQSIVAEHDRRVPTLALAQYKGLHCSIERAKAHSEGFGSRITKIFSQVNNDESVLAYRSRFSKFDIGAPADIASFFKYLGYNVTRKDREGKEHISSDDEILKVISHPVAALVLEYRELSKLKSTYSDVFIPGIDGSVIFADGLIHTEFTSVFTTTGRTSSRKPNIQNLPARKHKEIRDIIVAPKGYILTNCDASQIEFRCIVMTCKDPKLIQYVWDGVDIHGEWAYKIARRYPQRVGETIAKGWMQSTPTELKAKDKLFKQWRDIVKNAFVFASLYGARPPRIATGLNIPEAVAADLQSAFWKEFSGAKKWQDDSYRFYAKNGYIESLTGARRYGPLQSGEVINCVSDDTEILTPTGWKFVDDLVINDPAFSVNPLTGAIEVWPIEEINLSQYSGQVFKMDHFAISAVATPEHRWLVDSYTTRSKEKAQYTRFKETKQLSTHGDDKIWISCKGINLENTNWLDDEIELLGWVLTDGGYIHAYSHTIPDKPVGGGRVYVTQSKPNFINEIDYLFNRLGKHSHHLSKRGQHKWEITSETGFRIRRLLPDKTLTMEALLTMSRSQMQLLYLTMLKGDGCWDNAAKRFRKFVAGTKERADIFVALCALIGQGARAVLRKAPKQSTKKYKSMTNIPKIGPCWLVELVVNKRAQPQYKSKWVDWKGRVWCPTLKHGTWIAKRNGKVYITGNSPIQRVASDIVVDGMNRLVDYAFKTGKLQFIPVMNIHDDVGNYLPEGSWEADLRTIIDILLDCRYNFLNVPLAVEARYGSDFYNQTSYGTFDNAERLKERLA